MAQSLLWWFSKLPRWSTVNSQGRSDTPTSKPLADDVSTKPPTMANGTESDLIDTPPPSYEAACSGLVETGVEARNEAMKEARSAPQDDRRSKIVDGVMEQMEYELKGLKQVADVDRVSASIRQLCYFAACRISEDCRGHSDVIMEERRQTNHTEIYKLLNLVTEPITPGVHLVEAINITANAFGEIAEQFMAEKKYKSHWHARGEFHFMRFSIYRAATRVCTNLAVDKNFPPSTVAALVNATNCYHSAATSCLWVSDWFLK